MKNNFSLLANLILILIFLIILIKKYIQLKKVTQLPNTYYINLLLKKDFALDKKHLPILSLFLLCILPILVIICYIFQNEFCIMNLSFLLLVLLNLSFSLVVNDKYIAIRFCIIKKSDIDYFNIDYTSNIITIYLKNSNKTIPLALNNHFSSALSLLHELGYSELLTKKFYNFSN